jgi:PHP family Zn ribbon phosphoesterase
MSPANIIRRAVQMNLQVIGITDHNSTRQCGLTRKIGAENGISVLCGAEVTTREEVHCLAFFPGDTQLEIFQAFLDRNLPDIKNDPRKFGHQVLVDENEDIVCLEERLLISGLNAGISEVEAEVHRLGGLFIPAHIDRPRFSIISQLGFVPPELRVDALEISPHATAGSMAGQMAGLPQVPFIGGSDAHFLYQLGTRVSEFRVAAPAFEEIALALAGKGGRNAQVLNQIVNLIT